MGPERLAPGGIVDLCLVALLVASSVGFIYARKRGREDDARARDDETRDGASARGVVDGKRGEGCAIGGVDRDRYDDGGGLHGDPHSRRAE